VACIAGWTGMLAWGLPWQKVLSRRAREKRAVHDGP